MRHKLIKPPVLRPGDTVGIAAPASPFDEDAFEAGLQTLRDMGFEIKVPGQIFEKQGYLAGTDRQRASLLIELFEDDTVQAILCARGGFGSMKLLPLLDFGLIKTHPKPLVGYSDITALLVAIYKKCGMTTFHGPLVTTLGKGSSETRFSFMGAVASSSPIRLKPKAPHIVHPGKATGPVLGGNLTVLTTLLGTPYQPSFKGHILFLEDRGEALYRIDRMLSQLQLAGCLDQVVGVVLGSFLDCGPLDQIHSIVRKAFHKKVPILGGFDLGHGDENLTLPLGIPAELDTAAGALRFRETAVTNASVHRGTFMKSVQKMMRQAVDEGVFPGAVLMVSQKGGMAFRKAFGFASLCPERSMKEDTFFDLASLTKPLATVVSYLILAQRGVLNLDDTLGRLLPAFDGTDKKDITVRQLLSHSSGLPAYRLYFEKLRDLPQETRREALKNSLMREPLVPTPATTCLYSDLGFMILQMILEKSTGTPLDLFVNHAVYEPLGIPDLFFNRLEGSENKRSCSYAATEHCPWRGKTHGRRSA
jgi:muramoyltetrapeptide carboxypeptidase